MSLTLAIIHIRQENIAQNVLVKAAIMINKCLMLFLTRTHWPDIRHFHFHIILQLAGSLS